MSKRTIAIWYIIGVIAAALGIASFIIGVNDYNIAIRGAYTPPGLCAPIPGFTTDPNCLQEATYTSRSEMIFGGIILLVNVPYYVAWLGTLVNLSRVREWGWFLFTFFFGGIVIFIYLLAGSSPQKAGQYPQGTSVSSQPHFPPQSSKALQILQERYARGEIDTATFAAMSEQLHASEQPPS